VTVLKIMSASPLLLLKVWRGLFLKRGSLWPGGCKT